MQYYTSRILRATLSDYRTKPQNGTYPATAWRSLSRRSLPVLYEAAVVATTVVITDHGRRPIRSVVLLTAFSNQKFTCHNNPGSKALRVSADALNGITARNGQDHVI